MQMGTLLYLGIVTQGSSVAVKGLPEVQVGLLDSFIEQSINYFIGSSTICAFKCRAMASGHLSPPPEHKCVVEPVFVLVLIHPRRK